MFVLDFPVFVPIFGVLVNKRGDDCPCLFPFGVEWETKVGMLARVCLRIGLSGKRKRGCLPEFVYVLGGFGNKRGRGEDVSAAIRASDFPEFVYVLGRMGNKSGNACLCLFTFWVEWETKVGVIARVCLCIGWFWEQTWAWRRRECRNTRERFACVCLRFGLSGKQMRG